MAKPLGRYAHTLIRVLGLFLLSSVSSDSSATPQEQREGTSAQAPQPAASPNTQQQGSKGSNEEISSHDSPATFKVRVNLVLVRVVVRDTNGKAVANLRKEDFQLEDNRKLQIISSFSLETPTSHEPTVTTDSGGAGSDGASTVKTPELPHRFVTLFFDDLHLSTADLMLSRQAATKLLGAMQPGDRIAIFTTSGHVEPHFTADRDNLNEALQRILPGSLSANASMNCPRMTYYEAYQILERNDPTALQVATEDALACIGGNQRAVKMMVQTAAQRELTTGESQTQFALRNLDALIRIMSALPGQRAIVMMSPGFFVAPSMRASSEIIDRATKANIVINTIDARGLYVSSAFDASSRSIGSPLRTSFVMEEESAQDDVLAELADGTGGIFFHNRNDIEIGLLQAAAVPEVSYVLGFSPQNMKLDGKYHYLKVTLTSKGKWTLQARRGYFAPRATMDADEVAKEEIEQAVFSQEELRDIPIECQTQFFKTSEGARLTVAVHVETKGLRFRKAEERNNNRLTVATAIFDENGKLFMGFEKRILMHLKDATMELLNKTGISVKSSFDLQPGTFLVRIVVRDSEGGQMAAMNRAMVIP